MTSERARELLVAECQRSLPGGPVDDSTYSQIEDALDGVDAPMQAADGRWLTLVERINALTTLPTQTYADGVEDALAIDFRAIAQSALNDMRAGGESHEMCARWISERARSAIRTLGTNNG